MRMYQWYLFQNAKFKFQHIKPVRFENSSKPPLCFLFATQGNKKRPFVHVLAQHVGGLTTSRQVAAVPIWRKAYNNNSTECCIILFCTPSMLPSTVLGAWLYDTTWTSIRYCFASNIDKKIQRDLFTLYLVSAHVDDFTGMEGYGVLYLR